MRRIAFTVLAAAALAATGAPAAGAATTWSLRGAGWGHGVGMSQYGAYGFAKHGADYRTILPHYYEATSIGRRGSRTIRVLLEPNKNQLLFGSSSTRIV